VPYSWKNGIGNGSGMDEKEVKKDQKQASK
jgi:hypothetical protein